MLIKPLPTSAASDLALDIITRTLSFELYSPNYPPVQFRKIRKISLLSAFPLFTQDPVSNWSLHLHLSRTEDPIRPQHWPRDITFVPYRPPVVPLDVIVYPSLLMLWVSHDISCKCHAIPITRADWATSRACHSILEHPADRSRCFSMFWYC